MNVIFAGGGTGGHVYPAVAIWRELLRQDSSTRALLIGTDTGPERDIALEQGLDFEGLRLSGVVGKSLSKRLKAGLLFVKGSVKCFSIMRKFKPTCVVGTGGYASAPACLAAKFLRVPVILHEMNVSPGLVTRLFAKTAYAVAVAFEETKERLPAGTNAVWTGMVVREEIKSLGNPACREKVAREARSRFGFVEGRNTLLVLGGSQGAEAINLSLWKRIPYIANRGDIQIIHVTGKKGHESSKLKEAREAFSRACEGTPSLVYKPIPYARDIRLLYSVCDLALCRCGAGTLSELLAACIPSILVPLPGSAGGHQKENAMFLVSRGFARLVEQDGNSADKAVEEALRLVGEKDSLLEMKKAFEMEDVTSGAQAISRLVKSI